jgi:hypothetical protein
MLVLLVRSIFIDFSVDAFAQGRYLRVIHILDCDASQGPIINNGCPPIATDESNSAPL